MSTYVRRGVELAALVGAAAALVSCSQDGAVRSDDNAGAVVTAGSVDAFDVRVGDCYLDGESAKDGADFQVDNVDAVPCDRPHDNEVFATFEIADGDYPGKDEVDRLSSDGCEQRFADFVGTAYADSALDIAYLFPTDRSWNQQDDREVVCAVYLPGDELEGSVAGLGDDYALPVAGDCVDEDGGQADCSAEHWAEIYLRTDLSDSAYPGDAEVDGDAQDLCTGAFADYVGVAYEDSAFDYVYWTPSQEDWKTGNREVTCAVIDPAGALTGTVAGSGK